MKHLLLALVALIGLTAYLLWRSPGRPLQSTPFSASRREALKPGAPPRQAKTFSKSGAKAARTTGEDVSKQPRKAEPDQYSVLVTPDDVTDDSAPSRTSSSRSVLVAPLIPPPDQIALGVDSDAVMDEYGEPSAWATAAEGGHMVETFVYAQARGGSATVIRIVDGRVAAAYKKIVPLSPRGSLSRRIGQAN